MRLLTSGLNSSVIMFEKYGKFLYGSEEPDIPEKQLIVFDIRGVNSIRWKVSHVRNCSNSSN
jgi:hypothetical protein